MKIKPTASFWKNPVKWYRHKKIAKVMTEYLNQTEIQEELYKAEREMMLYGNVIMKNGRVVTRKLNEYNN